MAALTSARTSRWRSARPCTRSAGGDRCDGRGHDRRRRSPPAAGQVPHHAAHGRSGWVSSLSSSSKSLSPSAAVAPPPYRSRNVAFWQASGARLSRVIGTAGPSADCPAGTTSGGESVIVYRLLSAARPLTTARLEAGQPLFAGPLMMVMVSTRIDL